MVNGHGILLHVRGTAPNSSNWSRCGTLDALFPKESEEVLEGFVPPLTQGLIHKGHVAAPGLEEGVLVHHGEVHENLHERVLVHGILQLGLGTANSLKGGRELGLVLLAYVGARPLAALRRGAALRRDLPWLLTAAAACVSAATLARLVGRTALHGRIRLRLPWLALALRRRPLALGLGLLLRGARAATGRNDGDEVVGEGLGGGDALCWIQPVTGPPKDRGNSIRESQIAGPLIGGMGAGGWKRGVRSSVGTGITGERTQACA